MVDIIELVVGRTQCTQFHAVFFSLSRDERKIEFREVDKLHEIHHKYSVYPHRPGRLCSSCASSCASPSASSSILLYEDRSKHICEVRWLQCDVSPPKATLGTCYFCDVSQIESMVKLTKKSEWFVTVYSHFPLQCQSKLLCI